MSVLYTNINDILFYMKDNKTRIITTMSSLGVLVFFIVSLGSGLVVLNTFVEILFPTLGVFIEDGFDYNFGLFYELSKYTSVFIIFFPLYIYSSICMQRIIKNNLKEGEGLKKIQKVIIMIILVISVYILVGAAVSLIAIFLTVGLTVKALVSIFISAFIGVLVWIYYKALWKKKFDGFVLKNKVFSSTVCVVALLVTFYSIYNINPIRIEDKKESQGTIIRLSSIKLDIFTSNREEKGLSRLPTTLKELDEDDYTYTLRNGKPTGIEYTKLSDTKYELCANLKTIAKNQEGVNFYRGREFKYNKTGRNCWTFDLLDTDR